MGSPLICRVHSAVSLYYIEALRKRSSVLNTFARQSPEMDDEI